MRILLAVSLTLLALPLAACGDGGGDGGDSKNSAAKDAFIAKGDAICESVNKKIIEFNDKLGTIRGGSVAKQFRQTAPLLRDSVRVQEKAVADFRALDPPAEDKATIAEYLSTAEDQSAALKDMARGAEKQDRAAVEAASTRLNAISAKRRQIASDFGFHVCGGGDQG
jgi:methyl-accepting chemotaxis protein